MPACLRILRQVPSASWWLGLPATVTRTALPPSVAVTSPQLAVVRLHGRRTETWEAKGIPVVERFRYLYYADTTPMSWANGSPASDRRRARSRTCTC